jgi:curved DNA-binding protein CbpA
MKDYYNILGVSRNATFYDITKAYRELSAEYDPEKKDGG